VRAGTSEPAGGDLMPEPPRRRWYDPMGAGAVPPAHTGEIAPMRDALRVLAARQGWESHLLAGDLLAEWESIVGPQLAGNTAPLRLTGGVLVLAARTPLWAAEVRQFGSVITRRVNERLGEGTVRTITVSVRRAAGR
jgi:predicted nucleic acid-binding Zn ribbon protein